MALPQGLDGLGKVSFLQSAPILLEFILMQFRPRFDQPTLRSGQGYRKRFNGIDRENPESVTGH